MKQIQLQLSDAAVWR